ncbi:autotransporter outer membrane beta-barrel domain-containing protein [Pseudomonas sp. efr-133-TYG-103a]|uniref:autotransporter outer membrane beta-barrel domain-containing protein n=1 Tax=Pseudomonas sp. efr-133-TYG-103a TaxID=3040308 RepID=UPI002555E022|nr:autotransporter outer membrane beta-barrel domain-containing protein [Pseudomonas sp. efr-133-TYG-103a]
MNSSHLLYSRYFKPSTFISLALCISAAAQGRVLLPGESVTVNSGDTPESWNMATGATLTVNAGGQILSLGGSGAGTLNLNAGSSAGRITLNAGSAANIIGATITTTGTVAAFTADAALVTLTNSSVSGEGLGIYGVQTIGGPGATFLINGGSVTGVTGGMRLSVNSSVDATGTVIQGTGANSYGIQALNSNMTLRNSTVTGGLNGISYRGSPGATGTVDLVGTHVEGASGAAIQISGQNAAVTANLNLLNGTTLTGGNGNALEVTDNATATVTVQASDLQGNIDISNDSTADLTFDQGSLAGNISADGSSTGSLTMNNGSTLIGNVSGVHDISLSASRMTGDITSDGTGVVSLENDSVFTGNLIDVDQLTVGDPSIWNMTASNSINTLVMDTGTVKFGGANEFYQLNVGTLSGTGTFVMDVDYATNQHDTLVVSGSATGSHTLQIAGSGVDPASPQPLTVVQTGGGNATFALAGDRAVDVGTYSYQLASTSNGAGGTDWFLDPRTATISPGTRSVLALFNTAPTVWYGELTSLRSRMGELRFNGGKAGGWVRSYGNKYNVDEASGVGYQQTQHGLSLGADAPLPMGDGQWLIGVLAGHSTSDLDISRGTSGTVKSYYVGAYTTWLDQASGYYFDGVLKLNRFRNDSKVSMSDGTRAKGDYDNDGLGGSVEFGRHVKLDDGYFVEPFTQWAAVVIQGKDYGLDNGMQAQGDRTRSLLGKVGVTAGRNFAMEGGSVVQPYVRVAGVHEFAKNNEVQVNNNVFNNDLSGSRGELGAGVAVAFSDSLQLHADFDYSNGEHIEQPFGANVGLRYSW